MPKYVYVYVGGDAARNFKIGMDGLIWGWKQPRYGPLATAATDWLANLSQTTYLAFVQGVKPASPVRGWPRTPDGDLAPWLTATYDALTIARVAGSLYQAVETVWPDATYGYRVRFHSVIPIGMVTGAQLHPGAVEAIRDSTVRRGVPILGPEPLVDEIPQDDNDILAMLKAGASPEGALVLDHADTGSLGADVLDRLLDGLEGLDGFARVVVRVEQRALRRRRFGKRTEIACAICGRVLPVGLVRLAHIKRRAEADRQERLMLENTIPACTLGCDELFERGYLTVTGTGTLIDNSAKPATADLTDLLKHLIGRQIHGYSSEQHPFFTWHRDRHQR